MDATIHYASNGDSDADASYLRNLPIIKLLQKATIDVDDWSVLLSAAPNGEDKLFWCLGYAGALCAIDLNDPRYVRYQFDFGREEVHLLEKQEI